MITLGISGLEKSLDYELKNNNEPIQLTVDKNIQVFNKGRAYKV